VWLSFPQRRRKNSKAGLSLKKYKEGGVLADVSIVEPIVPVKATLAMCVTPQAIADQVHAQVDEVFDNR
jgi:hypothetical protein